MFLFHSILNLLVTFFYSVNVSMDKHFDVRFSCKSNWKKCAPFDENGDLGAWLRIRISDMMMKKEKRKKQHEKLSAYREHFKSRIYLVQTQLIVRIVKEGSHFMYAMQCKSWEDGGWEKIVATMYAFIMRKWKAKIMRELNNWEETANEMCHWLQL